MRALASPNILAGANRMRRVAVIGMDAAEPRLVDQLMAEGQMPNLARLRRRAAQCPLQSEANWRTGRVWETFLTGLADFPSAALFDPATYESQQLGSRRKPPFYSTLPGTNVVAVDVPYMSLWYDVPGAQVIWGGHDAGYPRASRPAGLLQEIDAKFGHHPAFHNDFTCAWYHEPSINTLADALITGSQRRVQVIRHLLEKNPQWNLLLTVLSEAHSAGEIFWHGMEENHPLSNSPTAPLAKRRLLDVYRELDRALGAIIAALPPDTTILVCSVHGMEMNDYDIPSMAILPELLYRAHFGGSKLAGPDSNAWRQQGFPPVVPGPGHKWQEYMRERFDATPGRQCWRNVRRVLGIGARRAHAIEALTTPIPPESTIPPEQIDEPRWPLNWQVANWYRKHWPQMRAFALPVFYDGRIRINLRGRERDGVVEAAEYHEACDWVERLLGECRNPRDGRHIVANVDRLRTGNPFDPAGPDADLVLTWNAGIDAVEHPELGMIGPFPYRRTGGHTDRGFAYAAGPGIAAETLPAQEAVQLTPSIVSLWRDAPQPGAIFRRRSRAA
jgi:hypothetical protein